MVWQLTWGRHLKFLQTLEEQGQDPPALRNRPRLKPWLNWTWNAFDLLTLSRRQGMGLGPIPLSEIMAFCECFAVTDFEERRTLIKMIQALDSAYLSVVNKTQAAPAIGDPAKVDPEKIRRRPSRRLRRR